MSIAEVRESNQAKRSLRRAPNRVVVAYEIWARLVEEHGTSCLRGFPGYSDEKLRGDLQGLRSSRLDRRWRVIYRATKGDGVEIVDVQRVTPHDYRSKG